MAADALAYVALHGTGTPLGDPIEVGALGQAASVAKSSVEAPRLTMGSVKSCYGHTEGAAGITGMLLAVSALQQQVRPLMALPIFTMIFPMMMTVILYVLLSIQPFSLSMLDHCYSTMRIWWLLHERPVQSCSAEDQSDPPLAVAIHLRLDRQSHISSILSVCSHVEGAAQIKAMLLAVVALLPMASYAETHT